MEQMIGTPPYRFEVVGEDTARIVEYQRNSLVGHWRRVDGTGKFLGRRRRPARNQRWVTCTAKVEDTGTVVQLEASKGRGAIPRALQLIGVLSRGVNDPRTIYRVRFIPPGPVTLVASWAGMPYPLFIAPRTAARREAWRSSPPRGWRPFRAARPSSSRCRLSDGTEGYVERDQIVAAPETATRQAGLEAARHV